MSQNVTNELKSPLPMEKQDLILLLPGQTACILTCRTRVRIGAFLPPEELMTGGREGGKTRFQNRDTHSSRSESKITFCEILSNPERNLTAVFSARILNFGSATRGRTRETYLIT